jgi:hypothetical protein
LRNGRRLRSYRLKLSAGNFTMFSKTHLSLTDAELPAMNKQNLMRLSLVSSAIVGISLLHYFTRAMCSSTAWRSTK